MYKKAVMVIGSKSDKDKAEKAKIVFDYFEIPHDDYLASADRTPEIIDDICHRLNNDEYFACLAMAGMSAVLPVYIKSKAPTKVVVGVPLSGGPLQGVDALYSIVQRPSGTPVATVGIDQSENGALLIVEMMAQLYPDLRKKLTEYKSEQTKKKGYDKENPEFPWK